MIVILLCRSGSADTLGNLAKAPVNGEIEAFGVPGRHSEVADVDCPLNK